MSDSARRAKPPADTAPLLNLLRRFSFDRQTPRRLPNHAILPLHMLLLLPGKILLVLLGDLLLFRDGSNITSSVKKACLPSAHPHAPHVVLGLPSGRSSYMLVYRRDVNRRPPYCIAITALRLSSQPPESGSRLIPLCSTHSVAPGGRRSQMPPKQGNINAT